MIQPRIIIIIMFVITSWKFITIIPSNISNDSLISRKKKEWMDQFTNQNLIN